MKTAKMISLIIVMITIPLVAGSSIPAADESVFSAVFGPIEPGGYWEYVDTEYVYDDNIGIFGVFETSDEVGFIITNEQGYDAFVENATAYDALYHIPNTNSFELRYRHSAGNIPLYFIVYNSGVAPVAEGYMTVYIDGTGPEIWTDLNDGQKYTGDVVFNMYANDERFGVIGGRIKVEGSTIWEEERDYPTEQLYGEVTQDTRVFPDGNIDIQFEAWDEFGNIKTGDWRIVIDNEFATPKPGEGEFTWFSALVFVGIIGMIAVPVALVMHVVGRGKSGDDYEKAVKEVDRREALKKKQQKHSKRKKR